MEKGAQRENAEETRKEDWRGARGEGRLAIKKFFNTPPLRSLMYSRWYYIIYIRLSLKLSRDWLWPELKHRFDRGCSSEISLVIFQKFAVCELM